MYNNNSSRYYSHHRPEAESERGRDPSGHNRAVATTAAGSSRGGGGSSRSSSINILEELQNIEQALSMASSHGSTLASHNYNQTHPRHTSNGGGGNDDDDASQDWMAPSNSTPPRPTSSRGDDDAWTVRDPPLSSDDKKKSTFYAKRFAATGSADRNNNQNNTNSRSPLVRFSEQLEVYSKHISQGCNTPAIPILRSKSSGSVSKRNTPNESDIVAPSSCGTAGSRDPTPRLSVRGKDDIAAGSASQHPREPAGITSSPITTTRRMASNDQHRQKVMSDPPIDRSRRLLMSPAGVMTRPTSSNSTGKYQLKNGALSLQESSNAASYNMTSILGSRSSRVGGFSRASSDMELNPRRLSSSFVAPESGKLPRSQSANVLPRQGLAPTPTNREQAPTPNNQRSDICIKKKQVGPASSPGAWNMTSLFSNPCQSPFLGASQQNANAMGLPPLHNVSIYERSSTSSNVPAVLNIPRVTSSDTASARFLLENGQVMIRPRKEQEVLHDEYDVSPEEDHSTTSSAESASEMLIGNYNEGVNNKERWERVSPMIRDVDEDGANYSTDSQDDSSFYSETTPPPPVSTREMLESTFPPSDSKIYSNSRKRKPPRTAARKQSYLQLGDDGSLLESNVGTEIMTMPESIEVRVDNSSLGEVPVSQSSVERRGAFDRFRSKSMPLNRSESDVHSQDAASNNVIGEYDDVIIKASTSETDGSDSGVHFPVKSSGWDRFDKDPEHGCEDNEILINYSTRKARSLRPNRMWIIWFLLCTVIICLSIGLPVYFNLTGPNVNNEEDTDDTSKDSSPSVIVPPGPSTSELDRRFDFDTCVMLHGDQASDYSERYQTIRRVLRLVSVGRTDMIDRPASPQRKALCWLAEDDDYQIDVSDTNQAAIIQRYSLAVLYFSLVSSDVSSAGGLLKSNFLSSQQECGWDSIMCSEPGVVSALLLSDKNLNGVLPAEIGNLENLCK